MSAVNRFFEAGPGTEQRRLHAGRRNGHRVGYFPGNPWERGPPARIPGNRAWWRGMRAGGPRSQGLASGIDHLSYVECQLVGGGLDGLERRRRCVAPMAVGLLRAVLAAMRNAWPSRLARLAGGPPRRLSPLMRVPGAKRTRCENS